MMFIALKFICYAVARNNHHTLLPDSISFYFTQEQVFFLHFFLSFLFPSFHAFIFEKDCTLLQCYYKGCIQSNQQLARSRLMNIIHSGSIIVPYHALGRRPAQETLTGPAGLHTIKFQGTEHSPCVWNR
jgi:hypothetical protein